MAVYKPKQKTDVLGNTEDVKIPASFISDFAAAVTAVVPKGADGADGRGIQSISSKYAISNSGTVAPSSESFTSDYQEPTELSPYLWTKLTITYDDNATNTVYIPIKKGEKGEPDESGADKVDKAYSTDYEYTEGLIFTFVTDHYIIGDDAYSLHNGYTGTATEVVIPKFYDDGVHGVAKVTRIGTYAFNSCSAITSITIPNSVTSIGTQAFQNCYSLTSITIPNSVTSIDNAAFAYDYSLTSITIPNSVSSFNVGVFHTCSSLKSITIPNSVTSIGINAFNSCSAITSITIPNSVTSIGNYAFYNCSSLVSITLNSTTPPTLGIQPFDGSGIQTGAIFVPYESLNAYKTATNWVTYAAVIYPIPDGKWVSNAIGDIETLLGGI